MAPLSTTQVLQAILSNNPSLVVEAHPKWFQRGDDTDDGEAQATIEREGRRYAISLEPLL